MNWERAESIVLTNLNTLDPLNNDRSTSTEVRCGPARVTAYLTLSSHMYSVCLQFWLLYLNLSAVPTIYHPNVYRGRLICDWEVWPWLIKLSYDYRDDLLWLIYCIWLNEARFAYTPPISPTSTTSSASRVEAQWGTMPHKDVEVSRNQKSHRVWFERQKCDCNNNPSKRTPNYTRPAARGQHLWFQPWGCSFAAQSSATEFEPGCSLKHFNSEICTSPQLLYLDILVSSEVDPFERLLRISNLHHSVTIQSPVWCMVALHLGQ